MRFSAFIDTLAHRYNPDQLEPLVTKAGPVMGLGLLIAAPATAFAGAALGVGVLLAASLPLAVTVAYVGYLLVPYFAAQWAYRETLKKKLLAGENITQSHYVPGRKLLTKYGQPALRQKFAARMARKTRPKAPAAGPNPRG